MPLSSNPKRSRLAHVVFSGQMGDGLNGRWRLAGLLPLIFFLVQAIHYWRVGGLGNLLWMCNVGNLLLAIGLFFGQRQLIRAAAIWAIAGLPVWIWYVLLNHSSFFSSVLVHVGGIVVAMIALRKVRMDRVAWTYAFVWYLIVQLAARLITAPELNVNAASRIQTGWEQTFSSYWKFWIVMTMVVAAGLWVIGKIFWWIWPLTQVSEARA